jgi:hypothetical protein
MVPVLPLASMWHVPLLNLLGCGADASLRGGREHTPGPAGPGEAAASAAFAWLTGYTSPYTVGIITPYK